MRPTPRLTPGQEGPVRTLGPITQTDVVRFAGAGGDFNPLHHDPAFAAKAGFPAVIAMGQFQAGLLGSWLSDWVGIEHLLGYRVRFVAPLLLGDTITLGGRVTDVDEGADGLRIALLDLQVTKDEGPVLTGTARVRSR